MERSIGVSYTETGVGTRATTHYNSWLHLTELESGLIDILDNLASGEASETVADAVPLSAATAHSINEALDESKRLRRVGPVISLCRSNAARADEFRLENFFGLDLDARHTGPNKVFINTGVRPLLIEVAVSGVQAHLAVSKDLDRTRASLAGAGVCGIRLDGVETRSLQVEPGHAAIVPVEIAPYRFGSAGDVLTLHGFFSK